MTHIKIKIKIGMMIFFMIGGIFLVLILFSAIFPNKIPIIDTTIRLPIQSAIMKNISHIAIKKLALDDNYNIINDQTESLSWQDIASSITELQPSDIFFTDSRYASSFFIPGKRQHSIIYIGTRPKLAQAFGKNSDLYEMLASYYTNDLEEFIIDSSSDGVHIRNIMDVANLKEDGNSYLEGIIGFRIITSLEKKQNFLIYALQNLGKEYDYDMLTEDSSAIYCSELIYHSLNHIGINLKTKSYVLGRLVVSPDDAVTSILQDGIPNNDFLSIFSMIKKDGNVINTLVNENSIDTLVQPTVK